jgi:hypothetical protein
MARRAQKNIFGFGKKVTYHRDVAKERRDLRAHALEERRARLAAKKQEAAERTHQEREDAAQLRRERIERKKADAVDRKIEREMREAGTRNPAESAKQYRLAQAVLSGTSRAKSMTKKAAQEIVDRTPAKLRRLFMKQNPEDAAAQLSEAWHGRPAKTATDHIDVIHYHGVLTDLGRLKEITVMVTERKGQNILFDKDTRLASSENGKQLYVVGGDQSIDLGALGIEGEEAEKDCVIVGPVYSIVYVTAKFHLGKADIQIGPYQHELAEDGGEMPILIYDTLNQEVGFAGGSYFIDPTDYDGSHSAGIRN